MNTLFKHSNIRVSNTKTTFVRYLYNEIEWDDRLIGITGSRGSGKTTILLQYIKNTYGESFDALYISLDDYYFTSHVLFDLAEDFYVNGGRHLFIDEVHKYETWSVEIKKLYDTYPKLKIVFSGSSALQIHKAEGDLSRRAAIYKLHELSFREYLNLSQHKNLPHYSLDEIIKNHPKITAEIVNGGTILPEFKTYLKKGVYPFFIETKGQFYDRLVSTINMIIEIDLPAIENINYPTTYKLRKLISMIADSVPFKVNISELSRKSNISRDVLLRLLAMLDRANLITGIRQKGAPTGHLTKPDKLYLNNSALLFALNTNSNISIGTVRETFFMNQLQVKHKVNSINQGDFLIDHKYTFEVGGKSKTSEQIKDSKNAFIISDEIEHGGPKKIPLWLFGFLY